MKSREAYLALPYTRRVTLQEGEGGPNFLASIVELPGVRVDGSTPTEALFHLQGAFVDYLDAMIAWGEEIPEPQAWPTGYLREGTQPTPGALDIVAAFESPPADAFYDQPWERELVRWRWANPIHAATV